MARSLPRLPKLHAHFGGNLRKKKKKRNRLPSAPFLYALSRVFEWLVIKASEHGDAPCAYRLMETVSCVRVCVEVLGEGGGGGAGASCVCDRVLGESCVKCSAAGERGTSASAPLRRGAGFSALLCSTLPSPGHAVAHKADTSMAMDTDSNADEEGADESQDGQDRPSPGRTHEDAVVHCSTVRAFSAPCSPSGTRPGPGLGSGPGSGPDSVSFQKAGERPSSLPPSSPRALAHNDWAYDSAVCPAERQHPGMQRDKEAALKPAVPSVTTSPCALKNNVKKEDGGKVEDSSPLSDQLVPDYAARLDESRNVSDGRPQTLSLPSDNCTFKKKIDISPFTAIEVGLLNGGKGEEISVKKEKMSQNLLQWTVTDVATYFSAAGFPEQAVAFRTQEIDGKSLLLMQRSDVLTGLSIRLGPALKIYERHVKVLQRTHFLEFEDL